MTRCAPAGYVAYLLGMGGLGDSIYQRPLVRAQAAVADTYLSTPWPELYADIPGLRFVCPWRMGLRTQQKNIARQPAETWSGPPTVRHIRRTFWYGLTPGRPGQPTVDGIIAEMEQRTGIDLGERFAFDLPDFGPSPVEADRPIAIVRPVTTRREWNADARAPRPEYVSRAAQMLREAGYHVVVVADIAPPHEWLEGEMPPGDAYYVQGELPVTQLLALVQHAAVVVGGVGWIVPATVAAGVPAVIIGGGLGGQNAPELLVDPRMDARRIRFILPDRYCRCRNRAHDCDKEIRDFDARFAAALDDVTRPMEAAA